MNEADRQEWVNRTRRILSSEMLSERIVKLFEMEMDECRADAKRNIQSVKDLIAVVYEHEDEIKRLNAYIESIFDGGNLDIETYEEYKERIE
tara:strand:- start:461 stop:736 length:276 start_codon:yes stop_codon:yes gene_type:complete